MSESGSTQFRALSNVFAVLALRKLFLLRHGYYTNKGYFKHITSRKDEESISHLVTDLKSQQSIITHSHTWPSGEI